MDALSAINGYKAVDYLVPYLVLDDPQLATVLENFASQSYPAKKELFNIDAVEPLKKLAESMNGPDHVPLSNGYVIGAISSQLCHYLHPRLIPILFKRAIYDDSSSSAQEFSDFHSVVGLKYPRDDKKSWETWWGKAQPLLEGELNLQTATGRELWMDHYAHADVATQKILMNLWFFEVNIDEAALIDLAEKNEAAKQVLAELWKRERLSENGKQAIVKRFLTFRLVNDPPEEAAKDKSLYGVRLSTISAFPFPDRAMVRNKIVVTVGDKINTDDGSNPSDFELSMYKEGKEFSTESWWASFPSPPQANASVEYRGLDFPNSWDEIWTLTWKVEPIQLTNVSP